MSSSGREQAHFQTHAWLAPGCECAQDETLESQVLERGSALESGMASPSLCLRRFPPALGRVCAPQLEDAFAGWHLF